MQRLINRIIPFLLLGVAIVAFAFGIFLLAYLFLLGAIVGLVLFIITFIREKFFPSKELAKKSPKNASGRIIDSNDWKKS